MTLVTLPLRTVNPLNTREHWSKRAKRSKGERAAAFLKMPPGITLPAIIELTRLAPRLMDDDGLTASFKAIRDGVADRLGVDDGSSLVAFKYAQKKARTYSIEIAVASPES